MDIVRAFVKRITAPLIARRDGLLNLYENIEKIEDSQYWSENRIKDLQLRRVKRIVCHAYQNTNFYKNKFDEARFDPYSFSNLSELEKIPILTKTEIRDNIDTIISKAHQENELHHSETGGTTGVKMMFFRDNACIPFKEASLFRFDKWTGWDFGDRMGIVWPATGDYVGHWTKKAKFKNELFLRQVVFPAAVMDEKSISGYVNDLIKNNATMIRAFTSPLYEIAKYIVSKGIKNVNLKGVITTGEPLYIHQRKTISQAFNCNVFDSYRSREAGPLAQECELHNGMHINAESLYIEAVQPENRDDFEDGMGDIVVTDLLNYGMPLIRYKMGDMGILSDEKCPCGRGLPLLKKIAGRTSDIFYTPDKKCVTAGSLVLYLVDEAPGLLGQVQIIQDKINHLIIRMTPDPAPTEEIKNYQTEKVKELFGSEVQVSFELVDCIPREKSGKYVFTKCLINKND